MRHGDGRYRFPAWMRPRVAAVLAGVVYCALGLALVAQHRRHAEQEAAWAARGAKDRDLMNELNGDLEKSIIENMAKLKMGFGEITIAILEAPTSMEMLAIPRPDGDDGMKLARRLTGDEATVYATRPTGEELDRGLATELAAIILDTNNYLRNGVSVTVLDAPEPQFGFRLRRGPGTLDLLFSLENASDPAGHVDLFLQTWTDRGELLERHGRICVFQSRLSTLLSRYAPGVAPP